MGSKAKIVGYWADLDAVPEEGPFVAVGGPMSMGPLRIEHCRGPSGKGCPVCPSAELRSWMEEQTIPRGRDGASRLNAAFKAGDLRWFGCRIVPSESILETKEDGRYDAVNTRDERWKFFLLVPKGTPYIEQEDGGMVALLDGDAWPLAPSTDASRRAFEREKWEKAHRPNLNWENPRHGRRSEALVPTGTRIPGTSDRPCSDSMRRTSRGQPSFRMYSRGRIRSRLGGGEVPRVEEAQS